MNEHERNTLIPLHADAIYGAANIYGNGATLRTRLQALVDEAVAAAVGEALTEYKARVLAAAQAVKEDENWCDEGFAQAMRSLDIEPPKRTYVVGVEVTAYQTVFVNVEAASEDDAVDQANGLGFTEVMQQADADRWQHENHDVDSSSVEVAA